MQVRDNSDQLSGDPLAQALNDELVRQFGPMLPSHVLVKTLGYRSPDAFRQALARGTVPVPLFQIPTRRGRFALARDVAQWICQQRRSVSSVTTRDEVTAWRPKGRSKTYTRSTAQAQLQSVATPEEVSTMSP